MSHFRMSQISRRARVIRIAYAILVLLISGLILYAPSCSWECDGIRICDDVFSADSGNYYVDLNGWYCRGWPFVYSRWDGLDPPSISPWRLLFDILIVVPFVAWAVRFFYQRVHAAWVRRRVQLSLRWVVVILFGVCSLFAYLANYGVFTYPEEKDSWGSDIQPLYPKWMSDLLPESWRDELSYVYGIEGRLTSAEELRGGRWSKHVHWIKFDGFVKGVGASWVDAWDLSNFDSLEHVFIEDLRDPSLLESLVDKIAQLPRLKTLYISDCQPTPHTLLTISRMQHLEELVLDYVNLDPETNRDLRLTMANLSACTTLPKLHTLALSNFDFWCRENEQELTLKEMELPLAPTLKRLVCDGPLSCNTRQAIGSLGHLEELTISFRDFEFPLCEWTTPPHLRRLVVETSSENSALIDLLGMHSAMPNLEELAVYSDEKVSPYSMDEVVRVVCGHAQLRRLYLGNCDWPEQAVASLLDALPHLEEIELSKGCGDGIIPALIRHPALRKIDMGDANVSDAGWAMFLQEKPVMLEMLYLRGDVSRELAKCIEKQCGIEVWGAHAFTDR